MGQSALNKKKKKSKCHFGYEEVHTMEEKYDLGT